MEGRGLWGGGEERVYEVEGGVHERGGVQRRFASIRGFIGFFVQVHEEVGGMIEQFFSCVFETVI